MERCYDGVGLGSSNSRVQREAAIAEEKGL